MRDSDVLEWGGQMGVMATIGIALTLSVGQGGAEPQVTACEGDDGSFIAALAGSWTVEATSRTAPGVFVEINGTAESSMSLGGCGLLTEYITGRETGAEAEIHTLAVQDGGVFQLSAVDSAHRGFTVSSGRRDGDILTLEWSRDLGDRVLRTRRVYRRTSDDVFELEHSLSRSADSEWELTYRGTFRRRGDG